MSAAWRDQSDCAGAWQKEHLTAVVSPAADILIAEHTLAQKCMPCQQLFLRLQGHNSAECMDESD